MDLFANGRETNIRSTIAMVEDVLLELGHFVNDCRVRTTGGETHAWEVHRGSAEVRISLLERGDAPHLRVASVVMTLDDGVEAVRLYRHLLSLNRIALCSAAFAVDSEYVLIVSERPTMDLDRSEVLDLIRRVELYADQYDDQLVAQFGGVLGRDTSP